MAYADYRFLKIERRGKIVAATIDNPPVNIITMELFGELARLSAELQADDECVLFSFSDRPVQQAVGMWREERLPSAAA